MNTLPSFLLRETKGNIAIATALVVPLLAAGAGFGVETAFWYHKDLELQQAADKSAYTAALEKRAGSNTSKILNTATYIATENGYQPGTLAVHYPPSAGAYIGDTKAIEVELSIELPRYFTALFFDDKVTERPLPTPASLPSAQPYRMPRVFPELLTLTSWAALSCRIRWHLIPCRSRVRQN